MGGTHAGGTTTVPLAGRPRVSILILAHRSASKLAACLASIADTADASVPFEVVVVANGPTAAVRAVLEATRGIRRIDSERNLGFAGGCNLASGHARGELLALLNDDVEVRPGWLTALVRTMDQHQDAGAVGSRMLYTDGTLHEAGSIVWADGTTTAVGRGLPGHTRRFRTLRQVDYCSAASLLVRTSWWDAVGGMDIGYHPGYCEDVDFCFAVHRDGGRILYEPTSVVVHHESSSFDAIHRGFLQRRNRERLRHKWPGRLAAQEEPGRPGALERALHRAQGSPRRVLVATGSAPGAWFDRLVEELRPPAYAVVLSCAAPVPSAEADPLFDRGVDVADEPPDRHLARPELLYEVVVAGPDAPPAVVAAARLHHPYAALVHAADVTGGWAPTLSTALVARSPAHVRRAMAGEVVG